MGLLEVVSSIDKKSSSSSLEEEEDAGTLEGGLVEPKMSSIPSMLMVGFTRSLVAWTGEERRGMVGKRGWWSGGGEFWFGCETTRQEKDQQNPNQYDTLLGAKVF